MEGNEINIIGAKNAAKKFFKCLNIELSDQTPERFAKMIYDLTKYQNVSNQEIAKSVNRQFEIDTKVNSKNMVIVKNIDTFSLCEHHVALMYDMKISIAYIPKKFILGLSKIVRLTQMVCKRLQLQEKIGNDIVEIMSILTNNLDIAVHIKAKHSCITSRGIHSVSTETVTTNFSGIFSKNENLKISFLNDIKN